VITALAERDGAVDRRSRLPPYHPKELALLAAWGLVEALWFRPALAWWRLKATLLALSGRRPGRGVIPRGEGILEQPAAVVAPLTR
jgi:hypothetical protein